MSIEGLIRRTPDLEIEPALAESWEILSSTRWRFHLRRHVRFQNGNPFDADDVVFTVERSRARSSDVKDRVAGVVEVVKIDSHTVDFITEQPNPTLHAEWGSWLMMDREWTEAHDSVLPARISGPAHNYAGRHANGTGPFKVIERQAGRHTILAANSDWWDTPRHNLKRVVFTPIPQDATRVAALLSRQVDLIIPVPVQQQTLVDAQPGTSVLRGPALRTIFLGFDMFRDALLYSDVKGRNPFKDERVRRAVYQAINADLLRRTVMHGNSTPSALLISPALFRRADRFRRLPFDPAKARELLVEAGYPKGFSLGMDCPNDRYVNDELICQAVASMLAKVGIRVSLLAQPKAKFYAKIFDPNLDFSFYLLGWVPAGYDGWNVLYNLLNTRGREGRGRFNLAHYSHREVDRLTDAIRTETDLGRRDQLLESAFRIVTDDVAYVPLHQQALSWGKLDRVQLRQRADNQLVLNHVQLTGAR